MNYLPCKWVDLCEFSVVDAAAKNQRYQDNAGKDITHIYSYNLVMSQSDIQSICQILNRTAYRVLAWYKNQDETAKAGLTNYTFLTSIPMPTTGGQSFSVYIYLKNQKPGTDKRRK